MFQCKLSGRRNTPATWYPAADNCGTEKADNLVLQRDARIAIKRQAVPEWMYGRGRFHYAGFELIVRTIQSGKICRNIWVREPLNNPAGLLAFLQCRDQGAFAIVCRQPV